MTRMLESYVEGRWTTPDDGGQPIADAVTGDEIYRVSSTGADTAAAVAHARRVGGPSLRAMTFRERAELLKGVVGALNAAKDDLHALSAHSGATPRDTAVDVDGGIGTMAVFASKGRKDLPDQHVLVEGQAEALGRAGTFVGQHFLVPRDGVAVQINAFNFPVWGPVEKLSAALLAGMPTIVKPAAPTAYLTEAMVRAVISAGVLPEGVLQLVCGGARDLLDHLGGQDTVAFTGSADTAARLRGHEAVTRRSVRFNAEADSLNASVLGPDGEPGTHEFDLFLDQLITEMTVKAGQKCTAIRRALVPSQWIGAVVDAAAARLADVQIGAPGDGVDMGALVSRAQRDDVRVAATRLVDAGELAFGSLDHVAVNGADPVVGAFLSPLLIRCDDVDAGAPHTVEAFGPVSTVLPYDDTDGLLTTLRRGQGSLVASVVTSDAEFARDLVLGAGAYHGRMLILGPSCAAESTGHGTPMPQLIHGGPGRAGGGEEEGGLRAVHHHLQRVAVQGGSDVLRSIGGSS